MDALSDLLRAVKLSGGLFLRAELSAPFGFRAMGRDELRRAFGGDSAHVIPFYMVTHGSLWLEVAGEAPIALGPEDLVVLPHGSAHALLDRPGRPTVPMSSSLREELARLPASFRAGGEGPSSGALWGFFRCNAGLFNPLLDALPTVMVVRRDADRTPWLAANLQRAHDKWVAAEPGAAALVELLVEVLFVEVVRSWLSDHEPHGWLAAIGDPVVGRALSHLHADPRRPWTVEVLGRLVGASRTVLAERFLAATEMTPIRYLTRWRMSLAAGLLRSTSRSVAEIADDVGYASEAALNRAFKREVGAPPAAWRRANP